MTPFPESELHRFFQTNRYRYFVLVKKARKRGSSSISCKDWIGVGKRFDTRTLRFSVLVEMGERMTTPTNFSSNLTLPTRATSTEDFVPWKLPHISAEIVSSKPSQWFSNDDPHTNASVYYNERSRRCLLSNILQQMCARPGWMVQNHSLISGQQRTDHLPL